MTAPIIPAELWPEGSVIHTWDSGGIGNWHKPLYGNWHLWESGIPMPPGHDWRVPVMRQQPNPAIDLEQFRPALEHALLSIQSEEKREDIDRLLALIDGSKSVTLNEPFGNSEQLPQAAADPEDVRIVRIIAEKIDEGRLDHPGFYKNGRLSAALRNLLALIDGQPNQQTHVLPVGWRVIPHSSPWREGERWEVYGPSGGGSISTEEIQEPVVRDLLDALAGIKPTKSEGE